MKHRVDYGCRTTPSWETAGMDIQHTTRRKCLQVRIGMVTEIYVNGCATYITVKLLSADTFSCVTGLNMHLKENSHYINFNFSPNTEREMQRIKANIFC